MTVQLLVSVRSPEEADAALTGGANIIDVKEPSRGSLGAASPGVIDRITQHVLQSNPETLVSAAMGEAGDLLRFSSEEISQRSLGRLNFLKCGLAGLQSTDWKATWAGVRQQYRRRGIRTQWVAVSYADWERSQSPMPLEVLTEGASFGSPVLLVDTFTKDDTNLLDWLDHLQLRKLRDATREAGMKLALAGRIEIESLPEICKHSPDIVAIRGAVCEQGKRTEAVSADRVQAFRASLETHWNQPVGQGHW